MKTRNMILSGAISVLVMLVALNTSVVASSFPQEASPGNIPPELFLLMSSYDICKDDKWGGSRPDGFDLQDSSCISLDDEIRFEEYAFTGEQINFLVLVRDLNGAVDISYAKMTVAGYTEALCNDVSGVYNEYDFGDQVPAKPFAHEGFDPMFDKIFECILTVEPSWYGMKSVNVDAYDQAGAVSTMGIAQSWFFNPAIMLQLTTNDGSPKITYEAGLPGQTVMSTNKLVITNLAEGGVDLWAFIAASDLTDPTHSGAKCPVSNVLDTDEYMEFRCKIGTIEDDSWDHITNKDNLSWCCPYSCMGALPLLKGYSPYEYFSIIKNLGTAECQFRLTYPTPCIGNFTEGMIHVIVRAV